MPIRGVPAIFDGKEVKLLEPVPVKGRCSAYVVFVTPDESAPVPDIRETRMWKAVGAWPDERPAEEIIAEIRSARRSRADPPQL